jgi:hypothetical protein
MQHARPNAFFKSIENWESSKHKFTIVPSCPQSYVSMCQAMAHRNPTTQCKRAYVKDADELSNGDDHDFILEDADKVDTTAKKHKKTRIARLDKKPRSVGSTPDWTHSSYHVMIKPTDYNNGFLGPDDQHDKRWTDALCRLPINGHETDMIRNSAWKEQKNALKILSQSENPNDIYFVKKTKDIFGMSHEEDLSYTPLVVYTSMPQEYAENAKMYQLKGATTLNYTTFSERWTKMFEYGFFMLWRHTFNKELITWTQSGKEAGRCSRNHFRHFGLLHKEIDEQGRQISYFSYHYSQFEAIQAEIFRLPIVKRAEFAAHMGYRICPESIIHTKLPMKVHEFEYITQPKNGDTKRPHTLRTQHFLFADTENCKDYDVDIGTSVVFYRMKA